MTMEMRTVNYDRRRWTVLVASCLINLCIGSIYAWSVFSAPLAAKLTELAGRALTAADLAIVFTVANAVGPITMISGGFINDRLGPKWVILTGGTMFAAGTFPTAWSWDSVSAWHTEPRSAIASSSSRTGKAWWEASRRHLTA